jgi:hypothetical protein
VKRTPFHPSQVDATKAGLGSQLQASWSQKVELGDVRIAADGKIHLAIKLTGGAGPAYGRVTLDGEGRVVHAAGWPAGVYLPSLFRGPDHELFVLGNVEENEKEREVIFLAREAQLPPSRPRLAANLVDILGVSNGAVVRFLADFMQKGAARLVVDPLLPGGKRVAVKLPSDPYPQAALLDGQGRVHVITRGATKGRHMVFDLQGKPVDAQDFDLTGIGGLGGLRPLTLALDGSGVYVTGHEHGLGLVRVDAKGGTKYEEFVKLPFPDAKVYMVLAARSDGSASVTSFTWGSDSTSTTGAGWIVVRDGRAERSVVSEPGGYRDERDRVHAAAPGATILRGVDVMADGVAVGVFSSKDTPTELSIVRISG